MNRAVVHTFAAFTVALLLAVPVQPGAAQDKPSGTLARYPGWEYSGSLFLLTTPEGADLPASASEGGFPVLVRLDKDWFDFKQAKAKGEDVRFSTSTGQPLAYEIDEWNAAAGTASLWVRVPTIKGNARQEIKMYWGNADAKSESSGYAVFNESNGYLAVWHMNEPVRDEAGALESKDTGTTSASGIIGKSRHFDKGRGINCGEKITTLPTGSSPHTSEAWFRAEKPNATVLAWGNEERDGKVMLQFFNPPHMKIECYFSGADVEGGSTLATSQWIHVVHAFKKGDSRLYVNGALDGVSTSTASPLNVKRPARMYLGGWYDNYQYVGDLDEVRISKVARSADWMKLQYENQKPLQTAVGPLVQPGTEFSVSEEKITVWEGKIATISAKAGGAQKVYWILKGGGRETVVAVDRFTFTFHAGRVTGDQSLTLQFKAVYADTVKTADIAITVKEAIPDPIFALQAPVRWDGRETIVVAPQISNLTAMQAAGAGELKYDWTVSGLAVVKEIAPGRLMLKRAQNSGTMTVAATVSNGGKPITQSVLVAVNEPKKDAWVRRAPGKEEKPVDHQFYARDDNNEGTLFYNGTLTKKADLVFLRVYANGKIFKTESQEPTADGAYAFSAKLRPGLIQYKVEFGTASGNRETVLHTVTDLVCGDAYLIDGQSNAVATDWGEGEHAVASPWIRSFGSMGGDVGKEWGNAVRRQGGAWEIGYWGMDLAKRLVEGQKIPICIINGAVGGTRIDQHLPNPANRTDATTIYGRLLRRVEQARLTHGIRGVLWHQGEADQGADGPDNGYGCATYQQYFVDLSAAWKQDMPNIQHYYLYQIWPNACSQGGTRHSDKLRDVQRTLPRLYSNMSVMSTLGIKPPGPCHYPAAGYAEMARLICPLVERDNYGKAFDKSITAPDVKKAYYTTDKKDEIALEFDQPMAWNAALGSQFYLDGKEDKVASGAVSGNVVKLKLASAAAARTITYLVDKKWDAKRLLYGKNVIAALTFCEVPLEPTGPNP